MLDAPTCSSITPMMSFMHDTDLGKMILLSSAIFFVLALNEPCLDCGGAGAHSATFFYASGSFYEVIGDGLAVRKSAVGHVVHSVSSALTELMGQYVKWPENEDAMARTKRKFFSLGGMPNTIGAIDCTHVHIQAPRSREWEYVTVIERAGTALTCSLWGMLTLLSPTVSYDGLGLYTMPKLQQTTPDGILLGDSGYPLLPWLMTPFATVTNDSQQRYNSVHATTRGTIERLNGVIKRRFACLNYLRVESQKACHIICACIVLHNIPQTRIVPLQEALIDGPPPCAEVPDLLPPPPLQPDLPAGRAVRNAVVNLYFSN
ncbi:putative nuclease HARBI1 [Merluccius polli]|uniref:Nuclease HARBI1 n=1 Tax=Merluccius polli TaxID=89951 RepID=A0AA47MKW6_MERPO|nr:putative nuclease HARBI1 [Merluccius polli]